MNNLFFLMLSKGKMTFSFLLKSCIWMSFSWAEFSKTFFRTTIGFDGRNFKFNQDKKSLNSSSLLPLCPYRGPSHSPWSLPSHRNTSTFLKNLCRRGMFVGFFWTQNKSCDLSDRGVTTLSSSFEWQMHRVSIVFYFPLEMRRNSCSRHWHCLYFYLRSLSEFFSFSTNF